MVMEEVAAAIERVKVALRRRPGMGIHDDSPATVRWEGGTRTVARHANGARVATDMPPGLGGGGGEVTPGWLFRAGLASCAATTIAMRAAAEGIDLAFLEVEATSRSDTRGLIGLADASGEAVFAGPSDVELHVRIRAPGVPAARLRELVEKGRRCAPVPNALLSALPVGLRIDVEAA